MSISATETSRNDAELDAEVRRLQADPARLRRLVIEHRMVREALDDSPIGFCVYDRNDILIAHNNRYREIYAGTEECHRLLKSGEPVRYRDLIRAKLDGKVPDATLDEAVERRVAAQREADGRPVARDYAGIGVFQVVKYPLSNGAVAGMAIDISELKAREAELRAANARAMESENDRMLFFASASHELRTPLNAIIGFTELSRAGLDEATNPKECEYLDIVQESGRHLVALIGDLLAVADLETRETDIDETELCVGESLRACWSLLQPLADEKSITFRLEEVVTGLTIRAESRAVHQILINLASNALSYSPDGSKVSLGAHIDAEGRTVMRVTDSGPGISSEDLEKICKPFVRGSAERRGNSPGAGLGLSIVNGLCDLHDAEFWLESTLGSGTSAFVRFPPERTVRVAEIPLSRAG